jgi:hypothetical protein
LIEKDRRTEGFVFVGNKKSRYEDNHWGGTKFLNMLNWRPEDLTDNIMFVLLSGKSEDQGGGALSPLSWSEYKKQHRRYFSSYHREL